MARSTFSSFSTPSSHLVSTTLPATPAPAPAKRVAPVKLSSAGFDIEVIGKLMEEAFPKIESARSNVLNNKRGSNDNDIETENKKVVALKEEKDKLEEELKRINTSNLLPYGEKEIYQASRSKTAVFVDWLLGHESIYSRTFHIPTYVKIKEIKKECRNGIFMEDKTEQYHMMKYKGFTGGNAWYAECQSFVEKRHIPDNAIRIVAINTRSKEREDTLQYIKSYIEKLKRENETIAGEINCLTGTSQRDKQARIDDLTTNQREFTDKIKSINNEILAAEKKFKEVEAELKNKATLLATIYRIFDVMSYKAAVVEDFKTQYEISMQTKPRPTLISYNGAPNDFFDTFTGRLMEDPVDAECSHTFERTSVFKYLDDKQEIACPCSGCNQAISRNNLKPNKTLKRAIEEWKTNADKEEKRSLYSNPDLLAASSGLSVCSLEQLTKKRDEAEKAINDLRLKLAHSESYLKKVIEQIKLKSNLSNELDEPGSLSGEAKTDMLQGSSTRTKDTVSSSSISHSSEPATSSPLTSAGSASLYATATTSSSTSSAASSSSSRMQERKAC